MSEIRNIVWHSGAVTREKREKLNQHAGAVIWFTGLSGSGKSTLAHATEEELHRMGCHTFVLDGDNVRHGLCSDLGFSEKDRRENIRRIGEVSKLFVESGTIVLTSFISPYRADRKWVRDLVGPNFIEVYCNSPLEVCEERDVKGLYRKARAGEIKDFTGISSPYESPESPEVSVDTAKSSISESVAKILGYLRERSLLALGATVLAGVTEELLPLATMAVEVL